MIWLWFMSFFLGCEPEIECSEEIACEFGTVCEEGFCIEIPCSTSAQCGMEQYCEGRTCVDGCSVDDDSYPGDICHAESSTCVERGCRDTQLDCGFSEFCNEANGECYGAGGYYCKSCEDDSACGSDDNMCLNFGGGYTYCGVYCEDDSECPSGFGCLPIGDFNGNIVSFQCITYCWLYDDYDGTFPADTNAGNVPMLTELDVHPVCEQEEAAL
ncbi:MAG: hypothetical protein GY884_15035 [Proteobacteria bacterium]|nr:hypothetical protein [Pseudomonadota bacterium]